MPVANPRLLYPRIGSPTGVVLEDPDGEAALTVDGAGARGRLRADGPNVFDVRSGRFGGNLQDAIDAAASAPGGGTVLVPDRLLLPGRVFLWGAVDLVASSPAGELRLTGDLGMEYWINCGLEALGGSLHTWTGSIRGLRITAAPGAGALHAVNIHKAADYTVSHCCFDMRETPGRTGGIGCQNNGAYTPDLTFSRTNARILHSHFRYADRVAVGGAVRFGAEGIGHAHCDGLLIDGCTAEGSLDDALGLHFVNRFQVRGSRFRTLGGRLYMGSCTRGSVEAELEYIADPDGAMTTSQGLHLEMEAPGYPTCRDISVRARILVPEGAPPGSAARLSGARDVDVEIDLVNRSGHERNVVIEAQALAGWVDPTGVEPDTKARARGVTVRARNLWRPAGGTHGGRVVVAVPAAADAPGPIMVSGRVEGLDMSFRPALGGTVSGVQLHPAAPASAYQVAAGLVAERVLVGVFSTSASPPANVSGVQMTYTGDQHAPGLRHPGRAKLVAAVAAVRSAPTAGTFSIRIIVNGAIVKAFTAALEAGAAYGEVELGKLEGALAGVGDLVTLQYETSPTWAIGAGTPVTVHLYAVPLGV